ncbi:MAG: hypothetical protein K2Z81_23320 [Cyanobacteria bacterium]|nr:hypothetical protein [Cyanobacteriota bacterium]
MRVKSTSAIVRLSGLLLSVAVIAATSFCAELAEALEDYWGAELLWLGVRFEFLVFLVIIADWISDPVKAGMARSRRWRQFTSLRFLGCVVSLLCCAAGVLWGLFQ